MKITTRKINRIPKYLNDTLSNPNSVVLQEQLRVKEYSEKIPPLPGKRLIIVPWSGGLDSTTSLLMALETGAKVLTVNFNYGQPYYQKEKTTIDRLQRMLVKEYPSAQQQITEHNNIDMSWLDNALKRKMPGEWQHIFPLRNYILLVESALLAHGKPAELWFSCVKGEITYSGGDKSSIFITEMKHKLGEQGINLVTPLYALEKSDLVQWALTDKHRYKIIKETISCFEPSGNGHCGKCKACFNRGVAFSFAGKLEDVGYTAEFKNFKNEISGYEKRLSAPNEYSQARARQLLEFISLLKNYA